MSNTQQNQRLVGSGLVAVASGCPFDPEPMEGMKGNCNLTLRRLKKNSPIVHFDTLARQRRPKFSGHNFDLIVAVGLIEEL